MEILIFGKYVRTSTEEFIFHLTYLILKEVAFLGTVFIKEVMLCLVTFYMF